jgi:hypothetical protein
VKNLSPFCTCQNLQCPENPHNHELGCAPCVQKKLKSKGIPVCFFNEVDGKGNRKNDKFADFAQAVRENL